MISNLMFICIGFIFNAKLMCLSDSENIHTLAVFLKIQYINKPSLAVPHPP